MIWITRNKESPVPMLFLDIVIAFLAISFLFYGFACLFSQHMMDEFKRYGLPQFRQLIGALEVAGGLGLVVGYILPVIQIPAASGLALLMLLGCLLRIRIKDSILQILPAFIFLVLSLFVLFNLVS
jgi:uncharacterized membrane protein YphA (DoxX/SURF4 family)